MEIKKLSVPSNEDEIKKHWKYDDKIYISCVCITFNQKRYVRDAINSFLAQKTDYRFEIIIHDDVSTDGTRDILLEYKDKYPSIIKLILQDENQYNQGKKIIPIAISQASGEYISLCEGDDFWIDSEKIQKQYSYLNSNQKVNICIHDAYGFDCSRNKIIKIFHHQCSHDGLVSPERIYKIRGQFAPTSSYFIRKSAFILMPQWVNSAPVSDFYIEAILGINGVLCIKDKLSVYRYNSYGSWTSSQLAKQDMILERNYKMLRSLENLSEYLSDKDPEQKKYVRFKKQFVYFNITISLLKLFRYREALFFWKKSFFGQFCIKQHIKVILTILIIIKNNLGGGGE